MTYVERLALWFLGGTLATAAISWIAFQLQQEQIAPALLFPVVVGAALGASLILLRRWATLGRAWSISTAVVWGLLLVAGQDYIGYRLRLRHFDAEIAASHPLAAAMVSERDLRPTFAGHISARVTAQPLWWTLDALLVATTAGCLVAWGTRPPTAASTDSESSV